MDITRIRNFCIIAHIDHGKSTLADRILEKTGAITEREKKEQLLDSMDLERERGITIKLNAVELHYKDYLLHLIDTPGHVDFTYEVSRSLAACEGAILIVDATQGIEAQTIANLYLALSHNLTIIPVINKIDLPNADVERVKKEIIDNLGFKEDEILLVSAKNGIGVDTLLEKIIKVIPHPVSTDDKLQALIFDSIFDSYKGVIMYTRIFNGSVKAGDKIKMLETNATYEVVEVGVNNPHPTVKDVLNAGDVGYITASIKSISDVKVGDTITLNNNPSTILMGYKEIKPMVFCGLYPIDSKKYLELKEALEKLKLNDASLSYEPETSKALGFGFRCGFLGMLHMDVIEERIEREFNIDLIATSPSVIYEVTLTDDKVINVENPTKLPDRTIIKDIKEPYIKTNIFTPSEYVGSIMELCQDKRGTFVKSYTKGYASFDYDFIGYKSSNLVKMDILLNGEMVDALSTIVHKDFAYKRGKIVVENLKEIIPRQLFEVPIQACIGNKAIARADIKAMRKNVLAKCYGGDITRKRKLLEKQKEGKKRMKVVGSVEIPQEAFLSVLSVDEK